MYNFTPQYMSSNNLLRVNGYEGAKAFQMVPNSTVALFDANEDLFYVKSSDSGGFSSISTYSFSPIKSEQPTNIEYITRKEFEELKEEIRNGKQSIWETSTNTEQSDGNAETISRF